MQCEYYINQLCRSCDRLDQKYSDTLSEKEKQLLELFYPLQVQIPPLRTSIGFSSGAAVAGSRNKAKFVVTTGRQGIQFGFINSSKNFVELENCPLHPATLNASLVEIKTLLEQHKIIPYDINTKKGELKYLIISKNNSTDDLLIRFVLRSTNHIPQLQKIAATLKPAVVTANIQPVHQAILEGDQEIVLSDQKYIYNQFDEFKLALGPRSFFQVTPWIAQQIYSEVSRVLSENPAIENFLDLYCGVGAFSFYASKHCKKVIGIEISKEAIECAEESKKINFVKNAEFQAADAESFLAHSAQRFDAVLVNPPRRGLNPKIVKCIVAAAPKFIFYSSCNAETMVRDFALMKDQYKIQSLQIFDMFPYTSHFETLMVLEKLQPNVSQP